MFGEKAKGVGGVYNLKIAVAQRVHSVRKRSKFTVEIFS
jgi:hypothetical protein